jgi:hypothetical protein
MQAKSERSFCGIERMSDARSKQRVKEAPGLRGRMMLEVGKE